MMKHSPISVGSFKWRHFEYENRPICGVGSSGLKMINFDQYIDTSQNLELHLEACRGLATVENRSMGVFYGGMPPEEIDRLGGCVSWSEIISKLKTYDPTGVHASSIEQLLSSAPHDASDEHKLGLVYRYVYFALPAVIPWFFSVYLKLNNFKNKTQESDTGWLPRAKLFPQIFNYVHSLPFKTIGRVVFFTTFPNAGVPIHRDSIVEAHTDHSINLFFGAGWRPSFIYDTETKTKNYLEKGATSYFFNNRDYHGVDPEPQFRYTLRVDGIFTDEMCDKLGLENGFTWKE